MGSMYRAKGTGTNIDPWGTPRRYPKEETYRRSTVQELQKNSYYAARKENN